MNSEKGQLIHFSHQPCDGSLGKGEHIGREDAHVKGADDSQDQSKNGGRGKLETDDLPFGFSKIHDHSNPKIIIDGDSTVKHTQNGQPIEF